MSSIEGVPLKWPLGLLQREVGCISAPEIRLPDYLSILQDTEYDFSLENWVLTGMEEGCLLQPGPPRPRSQPPAGSPPPSCPPYWLMLSSPQQSRMASRFSSDYWEPDPRPRSNSLNPAHLAHLARREGDSRDPSPTGNPPGGGGGARRAQRAFTPSLLNPPACLSSLPHRRRKNLRQCSLSALETRGALRENRENREPGSPTPSSSSSGPRRPLGTRAAGAADRARSAAQSKAPPPQSPWAELLSALGPEERDLLRTITDRGYPLHTALTALQKTGQQPPDKIFSYLGACEHLCELGYDEAEVEEALEMFQNSETKAEEFLNLLNQFNEMGFQQSTIKEVLLVHDNHRERALEELMMHVA